MPPPWGLPAASHLDILSVQSGWRDLNARPLDPQSSARAKLSYSPVMPSRSGWQAAACGASSP
jgi:hypothetical protein